MADPLFKAQPPPAVSIIIPAYNVAACIAETLDSVLAQTYDNYEVIVSNDGSTDETEQVVAPYHERFAGRLIYLKQANRGAAGARNAALRLARGRYVALLDADDLWLPEYLTKMTALLEADAQTDVVFPNAIFFGSSQFNGKEFQQVYPASAPVTFEKVLSRECYVFISALCRRAAVERVGGFDEQLVGSCAEDFDLWLRLLQQGCRFTFTTEPLVKYRRRDESLSSDGTKMLHSVINVYEKVLRNESISVREREIVMTKLTELRTQLHHALFRRTLLAGQYDEAAAHLARANQQLRSFKLTLVQWGLRVAPGLMARLAAR